METFVKIIFVLFAAFVLLKMLRSLPMYIWSIAEDIHNGDYKSKKWGRHAVVGLSAGVFVRACLIALADKLLHHFHGSKPIFYGVPFFVEFCICSFFGFAVCWLWEHRQGLKGSNRTKAEAFEAYKDIIVGTLFFMIGILVTMLFLPPFILT